MNGQIAVKRLEHAAGLDLPGYHSRGAAGLDLAAAIEADRPWVLAPGERRLVPTGLAIALPATLEGQVRPRSGLAARHGITVLNSPGTIDSDYRGEIQVILINLGDSPVTLRRGDRIAQLVIAPVARVELVEAERLDPSERGSGGFGSSGVSTDPGGPSADG